MTKSTAFYMRIDPKEKRVIERAAKIDRRTTSDFIRLAALDRAMQLVEADKQKKGSKKGI